jgi:hypothetical protein
VAARGQRTGENPQEHLRVPSRNQRRLQLTRLHHKKEEEFERKRRNIQEKRVRIANEPQHAVPTQSNHQKRNALRWKPRLRKWNLQCGDSFIVDRRFSNFIIAC